MTGKQVQIISALGASQGSLAVIAALLAALSGHFVSNVHQGHLNNAHPYVVSIFYICGSVATVLPLFTAIICSLSEQEAKVAYAFSLMHEDAAYDTKLENWWRMFATLRTQAVWAFYMSIPFVFALIAFHFYISSGAIAAVIICIVGIILIIAVLNLSNLFRENVLLLDDTISILTAPVYYSDKKLVVAQNIVTGRSESLLRSSDGSSDGSSKNGSSNKKKNSKTRSGNIDNRSQKRRSSRVRNSMNINETEEMEHFLSGYSAALS